MGTVSADYVRFADRPRRALTPVRPKTRSVRIHGYVQQNGSRELTPAQLRRVVHKANHGKAVQARRRNATKRAARAASRQE